MLLVKKNTQCCGNRNRKRIFGENFIWSYTAAKGGISALTHALAVSLAGRVRVNSISPGWIDTDFTEYTGAEQYSSRFIVSEILWILPIWYCFFALKKQALSQVKTSVLMVAWQNKWFTMVIVVGRLICRLIWRVKK